MHLLAAADIPTWVAIVVPVITGLFGLLAGAAMAAVVTTAHERSEKLRGLMIDGIGDANDRLNEATERLAEAFDRTDFNLYESNYDHAEVTNACKSAIRDLEKAQKPIGRLWLLFPTDDVGTIASLRVSALEYFGNRVITHVKRHGQLHELYLANKRARQDIATERSQLAIERLSSDDHSRQVALDLLIAEQDEKQKASEAKDAEMGDELVDEHNELFRLRPMVVEHLDMLKAASKQIRRRFL